MITFQNDLIDSPEDFSLNFKRDTSSVVLTFLAGIRTSSANGRTVVTINRLVEPFLMALTNLHPVEHLRFLDWLPDALSPWRRHAKAVYRETRDFYSGLVKYVKRKVDDGTAPVCFCAELWQQQSQSGLEDDDIVSSLHCGSLGVSIHVLLKTFLAGSTFEAGTDTTANMLRAFVLCMVKHPEIQKKAQDEIETILQGDLPGLYDIERLPYIRAIVKECLRLKAVAPMSRLFQPFDRLFHTNAIHRYLHYYKRGDYRWLSDSQRLTDRLVLQVLPAGRNNLSESTRIPSRALPW